MRCIIAGSRTITQNKYLLEAIKCSGFTISEIVSGTANGADKLGEQYANDHSIPIKQFYPNYNKYRRIAPIVRNSEMSKYGDCLIALWNGTSKGTKNMINLMVKLKKPVYVHICGGEPTE